MNVPSAFSLLALLFLPPIGYMGCSEKPNADLREPPPEMPPPDAPPVTVPPVVVPAPMIGVPISVCPNRSDKVVVLTFDDGPSPFTDQLLNRLEERNAHATFFLKTDNLDEANPDYATNRLLVRKMQMAGHEICNHTHSHRRLTQLDDTDVRDEMLTAENLLASETGRRTRCMRPPYTDYDDRVLGILKELGYQVILWSFDSGDWLHASTEFPNDFDPSAVLAVVSEATQVHNGPLIHIQHDNIYTEASVDLVPLVIDQLRAGGWKIVTLAECLGGPIDELAP